MPEREQTDNATALAQQSWEAARAGRSEEAETLLAEAIRLRASTLPDAQLTPQQIAQHFKSVVFTGGPADIFEQVGRESFITLLKNGLYPHSTLLDFGCGNLRLGYWLINFLHPGRYFGIDPERVRIEFGLEHVIGKALAEAKRPRFDYNANFDLSVFGKPFDFLVARSIWTHIAKKHIRLMLDGFNDVAAETGIFLASFVPAKNGDGYDGDDFVGTPLVQHGIDWIGSECALRGLAVRQLPGVVNRQPWLRIERAHGSRPAGLNREPAGSARRQRLAEIYRAARGLREG